MASNYRSGGDMMVRLGLFFSHGIIIFFQTLILLLAGCKNPQTTGTFPSNVTDKNPQTTETLPGNVTDKNRKLWGDSSDGDYYYEEYLRKQAEKRKAEEERLMDQKKLLAKNDADRNIRKVTTTGDSNDPLKNKQQTTSDPQKVSKTNAEKTDQQQTDKDTLLLTNNTNSTEAKKNIDKRITKDLTEKNSDPKDTFLKVKSSGIMNDKDLADLARNLPKPIIIQTFNDKNNLSNSKNRDDRIFPSFKFFLKKVDRLNGFNALNGPGKDYNLQQSPMPQKNHYYFLTDRSDPVLRSNTAIEKIKGEMDEVIYNNIKDINAKPSSSKGTGKLEIVLCDAVFNKAGDKEVFMNPRFINLKDEVKGDTLGFSLFYNEQKRQLEIFFSVEGVLYKAVSSDGENFSDVSKLADSNSSFFDRDPSISPDGKTIVFSSSRPFRSNVQGMHLFIAVRDKITGDFSTPQMVPGVVNSQSNLFPTIFSSSLGTFIFFKIFDQNIYNFTETLYSIEYRQGVFLPMVKFGEGSVTPDKYVTVSYSEKKGYRVMSSFPPGDYDIFRLEIDDIKRVYLDAFGQEISKRDIDEILMK